MMRVIKELTKQEKEQIINAFYSQFESGFDFEDFLKPFLESLGLKEVQVTKKTGDGGVDLVGLLKGVIDGEDDVSYLVQAKRYKPSSHVPPKDIDALRGNLKTNQKGIFITTGKVSDKAKEDGLKKDSNRPIIVFDGARLMDKLIDLQIGFGFKPVFSVEALREYINKNVVKTANSSSKAQSHKNTINLVKKRVTFNDIRASILSIPSGIVNLLDDKSTKRKINVVVDGKKYVATFAPSRNYLGGVTQILKDFGMKCNDGTFKECEAIWSTDGKELKIQIDKKQ